MESKEINAEFFLSEIKKLKLNGREFLFLIGNSKINNEAYNEIKESRQLTSNRLIELLENSPLTSFDYERLILAAVKMRKAKEDSSEKKNAAEADSLEEKEKRKAAETKAVDSAIHEKRIDFQYRAEQIRDYTEKSNKLNELKEKTRFNHESENRYISNENAQQTPEVFKKENPLYIRRITDNKNAGVNRWEKRNEEYEDSNNVNNFKININYEDDEDNYENEDFNDDLDDDENNNAKKIISFVLGLLLIFLSFGIRYMNTGSFLLEGEVDLITQVPTNYTELAEILYKLDKSPQNHESKIQEAEEYYIDLSAERYVRDKICHTNQYIFTVIDNGLYVTNPDTSNGNIKQVGFVKKDNYTINEVFLHEQRLYVVFESEYDSEYKSPDLLGRTNKENLTEIEPISGIFTQPVTLVEVYDAVQYSDTPLFKLEIDGKYDRCLLKSGGIYVFTDYYVKNARAYEDFRAYIPSFLINSSEREFIAFDNIYVPVTGFKHSLMKVFCAVDKNLEVVLGAVLGGGEIEVYAGGGSVLFIGQNENKSNIIRYDNDTNLNFSEIDGTVTGIDERNGIIRVSAELGEFSRLYIFNDMLEPLSVIDSIAPNEKQKSTLFDEKYAYIITDKLYTFDTTIPDEPIISEDSLVNVYYDDYYRWSDKERLSVSIETNAQEKRTGIRLTMNKLEKGSYIEQNSFLITAEESNTGSEFIKTPAESDKNSLYINYENGVIVIPVIWFDGISEVERYVVIRYTESEGFINLGGLIFYDWNKNIHRAVCMGEYVFTFWDKTIVSVKIPDIITIKTIELNN